MTKKKTESEFANERQDAAPTIVAGPADRRPGEKRFQLRVKNPTFNQERCGVKFLEGTCNTDSEQAAKDAARLGYEVTDRDTGKVVNSLDA